MSDYVLVVGSYNMVPWISTDDPHILNACAQASSHLAEQSYEMSLQMADQISSELAENGSLIHFDNHNTTRDQQIELNTLKPVLAQISARHQQGDHPKEIFACPYHAVPLLNWMEEHQIPLPDKIYLVYSIFNYDHVPGIKRWLEDSRVDHISQGNGQHKELLSAAMEEVMIASGIACRT
ncbi:hypothetical protein GC177_03955 [bacterium]|nr:hypothetical protein [bacterium]